MNGPDAELDVLGRVAETFLARYRRGERPSVTEYTDQYPELAGPIRELFPALVVLEELGSVAGSRSGSSSSTVRGPVPQRLGDYRIVREVGRGGMGIVYEAVQESLGRHVALKVVSGHGLLPATLLERFRREAKAAARLHHTNIVPVYGVGEHAGVPYYAMQFIEGRGLDEVLKEVKRLRGLKDRSSTEDPDPDADRSQRLAQGLLHGHFAGPPSGGRIGNPSDSRTDCPSVFRPTGAPGSAGASFSPSASSDLSPAPTLAGSASGTALTAQPEAQYFRSVARMAVQVAEGLAYAHQQGILHRDIKPSNLLLDARGTVWITDFGLAKAEGSDELTDAGDIVGTVRYMAPERFHGCSDPRSDVYSLGLTLYELLTLRPAFADSSRGRLIERVRHEDPPRPRQVDRSIPRDLETIVLKAIAKDPGRRYPAAAELAEDLGRFLAGEPVRARRIGLGERAVKWTKRRPAVAGLLAVTATAALALIAGTLVHNTQLEAALQDARRAEQEKTRQLAIAHLREAQARRTSGLVGRRFESLEALRKAADHFRALGQLDEERTLELRNEAIACLALADLKSGKEWTPDPGWSRPYGFDPALQHYVVRSSADDHPEKSDVHQGHLSVRRVADDREVAHLPGFGIRVAGTWFSPDGRYLAVYYEWDGQRQLYVWELSRRAVVLKLAQDSFVSSPAFSPDSRRVALSRPDQSIRIWELPSGTTGKDLPPGPPVQLVQFHPDGRRLTVVNRNRVMLRDLEDGHELATFQHPNSVHTLAWRSDGQVFATGCDDHDIYVWDVANPAQPLRVLKGHFAEVVNLAFSRSGDLLFSNSWDSTNRLWDPRTGQQLLSKPGGSYHEPHFGPDDQGLDYGWQVATGRECRTFHGLKRPLWVTISPGGRLLASVCADGVQLWDLAATREGDKLLQTLPLGKCLAVHFDPKGESLLTHSNRAGLQRWPITPDPPTGGLRIGPPQSLLLSARAPFVGNNPDFALHADGRTIAFSPHPGHVLLFDWANPRRQLLLESRFLRHFAFSPDGRWLATGNWHGRGVKVWNARAGQREEGLDLGEQEAAPAPVETVYARTAEAELDLGELEAATAWPAFSPDGRWLVTGTYAEYRFWEVGTWQKKHGLPRVNAGHALGWIVFAPDSKMLAVLHSMTEVRLVDPATGRSFAHLPVGGGPYCFSPDGSQLVTYAGRDGAFQVWDLRLIRRQLAVMGLDWDLPPYPPPSPPTLLPEGQRQGLKDPLRVQVVAAEPPPPSAELDAQAHRERGLLFMPLRTYAAWDDFNRASTLDPQRPPWEEVVRAAAPLIARYPQDSWAYHLRALAHKRLGQWQQALDDYFQAIQRAPERLYLLAGRGRTYLQMGETDKAAADFRKASERKPEQANRLAWELATAPNASHRVPSLAVELAGHAVRLAPAEATYWNTLGVAHYRAGDWKTAIQALEEAEKLAPGKEFSFNAFFLAMCYQQLGDAARAQDYYERAVRWCQENQGKLSAAQQQELKVFRAEAEDVLKTPPSGP
jgi:WD40 repeat protein/tetratricopeptide (TPR) repeat protein